MKAALQNYHARMQRVLAYIDRHLDGDLDLETVSRVEDGGLRFANPPYGADEFATTSKPQDRSSK